MKLTSSFSHCLLVFCLLVLGARNLAFATGDEKNPPANSPSANSPAVQGPAPERASPEFDEADPRESNIRGLPMGLIRRVVVFPLSAPTALKDQSEKSWWRSREVLTENRRFLIASRRFMVQKDVFQPRESLAPADAILLGRLLDAHALITFRLKDRTMKMNVVSGEDGLLIWEREQTLHPSLPIADQIESTTEKLSRDFIANMPYQGFQILDPLVGTALYEEGDVQLAKVDIGPNAKVTSGDPVQWIEIERLHPRSLFQDGGVVRVIGEGEIVSREGDIAIVRVLRSRDNKRLNERSLVRLPKELERLQQQYDLEKSKERKLNPSLVLAPLQEPQTQAKTDRPIWAAITSIASFVLMLALAF